MTDAFWTLALELAEKQFVPDAAIRWGIRRLCAERLAEEAEADIPSAVFAARMAAGPVAPVPEKANEQHYEAPTELFEAALGRRLKYSCCYWGDGVGTLDEAEEAALRITAERAELADGQEILELGCGWGSLSLWMAEHYPNARITAVSNSAVQREWIEARAAERGIGNLEILTRDMNSFSTDRTFDRIVSVEMFEHMRNYAELLRRIHAWLRPEGKLFIHIFCHERYAYEFQTEGAAHWLGRHFFTGGIMPSLDIFEHFDERFLESRRWTWSGVHYQRTAEAWLENLDHARDRLLPVLAAHYGAREAERWFGRWRIFFLACAELWGFDGGREWLVGHYLLEPKAAATGARSQAPDAVPASVQ